MPSVVGDDGLVLAQTELAGLCVCECVCVCVCMCV